MKKFLKQPKKSLKCDKMCCWLLKVDYFWLDRNVLKRFFLKFFKLDEVIKKIFSVKQNWWENFLKWSKKSLKSKISALPCFWTVHWTFKLQNLQNPWRDLPRRNQHNRIHIPDNLNLQSPEARGAQLGISRKPHAPREIRLGDSLEFFCLKILKFHWNFL